MKKLLIFSDMDGTIDRAEIPDFLNLFNLIYKYCEKKGYNEFSFNIVTGAWSNCRDLYTDIFLEVQEMIGQRFDFSIFVRLEPEEKMGVISSVIASDVLPKDCDISEDELVDIPIGKEIIYFDDCPHESLEDPAGKEYFESNYDVEFECVVPDRNIDSLIEYFEKKLTIDDSKRPLEKIII